MTLKHLRNLVKLTRRIERLNLRSVLKSVLSGRVPHINKTFTKKVDQKWINVDIKSLNTSNLHGV